MSNRSLVIVPVDGSQETERTVQYAVTVANKRDADVHAIQVVPRDGTCRFSSFRGMLLGPVSSRRSAPVRPPRALRIVRRHRAALA